MQAPLSFTFLALILAGCGAQTTATAVSFGLEPETRIADDASFEEPQAPSIPLTSRGPTAAVPPDGSSPDGGAPKLTRELCPVKCMMVVPGRASLEPEEETEFVAQVQPTMERLAACDASTRPSPTLTLRFAEDGSLIATGVDEGVSQGSTSQCLRDGAGLGTLTGMRSLSGAVVRCQERCVAGLRKPKRSGPKVRPR